MQSIADQIFNDISELSKDKTLDEQTKENFSQAINKLSIEVLNKVKKGEIEIDDVKDIKDISSIYMNMQQSFASAEGNGAPQATKAVSSFFNDKLNARKQTPEQNDDEAIIDLDKLANMDSDDINGLIDEQSKRENSDNVRKAGQV